MGQSSNIVKVTQRGVQCATGSVDLPGRPDGVAFGMANGRIVISITLDGNSTYAVLAGDAIDLAARAFADAVRGANLAEAPSLQVLQ